MQNNPEIQGGKLKQADKSIVFFDGICNLCNSSVDWIWRRNKVQDLYFASLQSDFATNFLSTYKVRYNDPQTIYFYHDGKLYQRSEAVFRIMQHLTWPYRMLATVLLLLPTAFTDYFYRIIADNRYRWFGKKETCRIPTPSEQERFFS